MIRAEKHLNRNNRILRAAGIVAIAIAAAMMSSAATAEDIGVPSNCPEYGVEAELLALAQGDYVLYSTVRVAEHMYAIPPTVLAQVRFRDVVMLVPVGWTTLDYQCCCPSELFGEITVVLPYIAPGYNVTIIVENVETIEIKVPGGLLTSRVLPETEDGPTIERGTPRPTIVDSRR